MLLYHPVLDLQRYEGRDRDFRDVCCGHNNNMFCNNFIQQRPINDCQGYQPPDIGMTSLILLLELNFKQLLVDYVQPLVQEIPITLLLMDGIIPSMVSGNLFY